MPINGCDWPLRYNRRDYGAQGLPLLPVLLRAIRGEELLGVGEVAKKAVPLDDAPDHIVEIGLLVFAQKIGEVRHVVIASVSLARDDAWHLCQQIFAPRIHIEAPGGDVADVPVAAFGAAEVGAICFGDGLSD